MKGTSLRNDSGPALRADRLDAGASVFLSEGFVASGSGTTAAVRFKNAHVAGQLSFRGATLRGEAGPALDAVGMAVAGTLFLRDGFTAAGSGEEGVVRLERVKIGGRLFVSQTVLAEAAQNPWEIDGLTYSSYPVDDVRAWLYFLRAGTKKYTPQPYQQFAAAARAAGHDADARRALIAQRNDQVARGSLTRPAKAWSRFLGLALGYGYQPWRALLGVMLVLTACLIGAYWPGTLAQARSFTTSAGIVRSMTSSCTSVEKAQVAVDLAIPLVRTGLNSMCRVTSTTAGQSFAWMGVGATLFGWALTALFAAGFTRAVRQP